MFKVFNVRYFGVRSNSTGHTTNLLGIFQELMSNTGDPNAFKNILCSMIFELGGTSKIREVCEAIRQMYNAYLIDVIDEVLTDDEGQEAYKAAGN